MSGITSLFSNPQQQAADDATKAAQQQDAFAQQMYQEALQNQQQQQAQLRGAAVNLAANGNPFAQSGITPQFLSPNAAGASFQGGSIPGAYPSMPSASPPVAPTPAPPGGGGGTPPGRIPTPQPPRGPGPIGRMPVRYDAGNVFQGGGK